MTLAELRLLLESPEARSGLVERLRGAADLLEGAYPYPLSTADRITLSFRAAFHLRDLAAALCEHVRRSADGSCRYCGSREGT